VFFAQMTHFTLCVSSKQLDKAKMTLMHALRVAARCVAITSLLTAVVFAQPCNPTHPSPENASVILAILGLIGANWSRISAHFRR
jgi:hypothetical protein